MAAETKPHLDALLEPGTVVDGRYRLDSTLGQGAMGTVYRGEHLAVGRPIALKVLSHELSSSSTFRTRFRAEARAASAAGHPNIIEVFDAGELPDGRPYLVMELLQGRELLTALRDDGPMAPQRACWVIKEVARALHAAHQVGIIHRDLKAENVFLVERDGREGVKVLDFGIAHGGTEGQRVTTPGLAMGTPEYMAPEQAYGAEARPTFDIYALGVLLFEVLVGEPPFVSDNPIEILGKKAANPAPSLRTRCQDLPDALIELVDACLAIDPGDRPKSAEEVAHRLEALSFAPPAPSRQGLLDKRVVLVAASLLVVALGGIGWIHAMSGEEAPPHEGADPPMGEVAMDAVPTPPAPEPDAIVESEALEPSREEGEELEMLPQTDVAPPDPTESLPSADADASEEPRRPRRGAKPRAMPKAEKAHAGSNVDDRDADKGEAKTKAAATADSATCQLQRRQAREARGNQDWEGVLRYTNSASCWPSARERDKLRVKAYMETLRFDRCVQVGSKSADPEVGRWVTLCKKRME